MSVQAQSLRYVYVYTDTRQPLYQRDANGSLQPWYYDDAETAEAWLEELAQVESGTGRPLNREWIDIVGLDADNFAKYVERNFPAEE